MPMTINGRIFDTGKTAKLVEPLTIQGHAQ